jgi:hypothetical protein
VSFAGAPGAWEPPGEPAAGAVAAGASGPGRTVVGRSSPAGFPPTAGIGRVAGRGTASGVVSARWSGTGSVRPVERTRRPAPGGRREAGTAPSCRTGLDGWSATEVDASGTMVG